MSEQISMSPERQEKYEALQRNIKSFLWKFVSMDVREMNAFDKKYGQYAFTPDNDWLPEDGQEGGIQQAVKDDNFEVRVDLVRENQPHSIIFIINNSESRYTIGGKLAEEIINGKFNDEDIK